MKTKIVLLSVLVVLLFQLQAQNPIKAEAVPASVKENLKLRYPRCSGLSWFMSDNTYVATFKHEGKLTDVLLDTAGGFIQSETHYKKNKLSPIVLAGLQSSVSQEWKLNDAEFIETKEHQHYYIIELKKGNELSKVKMDIEGNVVSN